jgi:hypothetical protein
MNTNETYSRVISIQNTICKQASSTVELGPNTCNRRSVNIIKAEIVYISSVSTAHVRVRPNPDTLEAVIYILLFQTRTNLEKRVVEPCSADNSDDQCQFKGIVRR